MIEALWSAQNGYILGLWLVAGFLLTWNRKLGVAIAVPAIVAALPTVFGLNPAGGGLVVLPHGTELLPYFTGIALPVVASILGGHVAIAVNPQRRRSQETRIVLDQVKRHAQRVEQEILQIESQLRTAGNGAALRPIGGGSGDERPSTLVEPSREELKLLRMQVSSRRQELRDLARKAS